MTEPLPTSRFTQALLDAPLEELQNEVREVREAIGRLEVHENLLKTAINFKIAAQGVPSVTGMNHGVLVSRGQDRYGGLFESSTREPQERAAHDDDAPSLREGILVVLADANRPLSASDIYRELERRAWLPGGANPKNQIGARISKMRRSKLITGIGESGSMKYTLPTLGAEGLDRGTRLGGEQ